jgi:hypothetical protein
VSRERPTWHHVGKLIPLAIGRPGKSNLSEWASYRQVRSWGFALAMDKRRNAESELGGLYSKAMWEMDSIAHGET